MKRKTFIEKTSAALLIGIPAISFWGCGDDDDDDNNQADCGANGADSTITENHGHTLEVPAADVNAGVEKTYNIRGTGDHDHMVTITAAQFTQLQGNNNVTVVSTLDDDHTHDVTVMCA